MTMTPTDTERMTYDALVDLARLAEDAEHHANPRGAALFRLAHSIAAVAGSPVLADPTADEAAALVDALDGAALEVFRVSYHVEHPA